MTNRQDGPDLFTWAPSLPPPPAPPGGHRDGGTYDPAEDFARLNRQAADVFRVMLSSHALTLSELSSLSGHPEASVSARLRDLRKARFGGHTVLRTRLARGLFLYRLVPREQS